MTFALVRLGWPNTAVILALAAAPIVAIATSRHDLAQPVQYPAVEFAENTSFPEKPPAQADAPYRAVH